MGGGSAQTLAWHYCLLAELSSTAADPHHPNTPTHPVANSNNIAQKNVWIVDQNPFNTPAPANDPSTFSTAFLIGHQPGDKATATYEVHTQLPADRRDFFSAAQVLLYLDDLAWARWLAGGAQGTDVEVFRESEHSVRLLSPNARLRGMDLAEGERAMLAVAVHFLTDMGVEDEGSYALGVIQARAANESYVGGGTIEIRRHTRDDFDALAGPDKTVNPGQSVMLNGTDIGEGATYTWYSASGQRLHVGKDWTFTPQQSAKYILEVTAAQDGFRDKDEVWVKIREGHIQSVAPNPASSTAAVQYSVSNVSSAQLVLAGTGNSTLATYPLMLSQTSKSIDISMLAPGTYNLLLVCDGYVAHAVTVQKL